MRKIFLFAAFICFAALNVNAQTEEPESKIEKMLRLTKTANENPTDWKAQLEAGHFLLDKENGMYNTSQAEKYYERIYHLATDYNKEIPDSVFRETGMMLISCAVSKKNLDKTLFYTDEMLHAAKVGVDIPVDFLISANGGGILYSFSKENMVAALSYIMNIRELLTNNNLPGIEHTDIITATIFEHLIEEYRNMFGDKLIEVTLDNKKYILIAKGEWNIEKPLLGWEKSTEGSTTLFYGEDDKVYNDKHGNMEYGFDYGKNGLVPKKDVNMRLITVTPERRQQMVDAYRDYMKKVQKNK